MTKTFLLFLVQKSHMIDNKRCDVKKALSKEEIKKSEQQTRDRSERGERSRGSGSILFYLEFFPNFSRLLFW